MIDTELFTTYFHEFPISNSLFVKIQNLGKIWWTVQKFQINIFNVLFYRAMKVVGMQRIEKMIDNDLMQIETGPNESTTTVDLSISMDRSEKSGKNKELYNWNWYLFFSFILCINENLTCLNGDKRKWEIVNYNFSLILTSKIMKRECFEKFCFQSLTWSLK